MTRHKDDTSFKIRKAAEAEADNRRVMGENRHLVQVRHF